MARQRGPWPCNAFPLLRSGELTAASPYIEVDGLNANFRGLYLWCIEAVDGAAGADVDVGFEPNASSANVSYQYLIASGAAASAGTASKVAVPMKQGSATVWGIIPARKGYTRPSFWLSSVRNSGSIAAAVSIAAVYWHDSVTGLTKVRLVGKTGGGAEVAGTFGIGTKYSLWSIGF